MMDQMYEFCLEDIRSRIVELLLATPLTLQDLNAVVNELSEFQEAIERLYYLVHML